MESNDLPFGGGESITHTEPVDYLVRFEVMDDDHWTTTTDLVSVNEVFLMGDSVCFHNTVSEETLMAGCDSLITARTEDDV